MNLSTSTIVAGDAAVITLSGEIDMATVPLLHDALTKALTHHPGRELVIDLDGVTVLDDIGLGVLLGAAGSARQNGADLAVVCNNSRLRDRLDLIGFSRAVEVRDRTTGDRP
ncbi:MAG: anti-sigma factor antagonist [Ilumatobacteraceae bacterium]